MLELLWLIPALPLAGFLVLLAAGRKLGAPLAGWLATAMCAGAFLATVAVFLGLLGKPAAERSFTQTLWEWVPAGGFSVDVGLLADPLSITMALFVTGVGTLIHLYAIGYMRDDPGFSRFFTYMNLFAFSMLVLVLGDNLVLTFLGWEGVGVASYLLVSFWFGHEASASAGKKAFITNRIGDLGFLLAIMLTFATLGTVSYVSSDAGPGLVQAAAELAPVTATAIVLLLFLGAVGKSAQLPLFVWLPDAMAGPMPVSALIHAATMVTAGVYLMARVNPVIAQAHLWAPEIIAWVGAITALFAATVAVAQTDIKRVLAYSTVSQLGYMFLAVGVGAYVPAIFHMVTHAFFKALLFLGAGSVIHGMSGEQDMARMGALRALMPLTAATFIIGWLAIAGIPPFAGFWSKDEILLYAFDASIALWAVGLVTALLTAYYMSRQVFLVFFGEARWRRSEEAATGKTPHPHEPSWLMTTPLVVLAGLTVLGGGLNLPFARELQFLDRWLDPVVGEHARHLEVATGAKWALAGVAVAVGALGVLAAARVYLQRKAPAFEPELAARGWYFDEAVSRFVGDPGRAAFEGVAAFDTRVVDGAVNGVAALVRRASVALRRAQTGFVRTYALAMCAGAAALLGYFLARGQW